MELRRTEGLSRLTFGLRGKRVEDWKGRAKEKLLILEDWKESIYRFVIFSKRIKRRVKEILGKKIKQTRK